MKLLFENWRKFLGRKKPSMPKLNPPLPEDPVYDPKYPDRPRSRVALNIDAECLSPEAALDKLEKNIQHFVSSDRDLNLPVSGIEAAALRRDITSQEKALSACEAAETIDAVKSQELRNKLDSFKEILGHVDTLSISLYKEIKKELTEIRKSILNG